MKILDKPVFLNKKKPKSFLSSKLLKKFDNKPSLQNNCFTKICRNVTLASIFLFGSIANTNVYSENADHGGETSNANIKNEPSKPLNETFNSKLFAVIESASAFNTPGGMNVPQYLLYSFGASASFKDYGLNVTQNVLSNPDLVSIFDNAFSLEIFKKNLGFIQELNLEYNGLFRTFRVSADFINYNFSSLYALDGFKNVKISGKIDVYNGFEFDGSAKLVSSKNSTDVVGGVNISYIREISKNFTLGASLGLIINGENSETLKRDLALPLALVFISFEN